MKNNVHHLLTVTGLLLATIAILADGPAQWLAVLGVALCAAGLFLALRAGSGSDE